MIYRRDLRANPESLYLFGDNTKRVGIGGQAREMRGEPNAVGIATKNAPGSYPATVQVQSSDENLPGRQSYSSTINVTITVEGSSRPEDINQDGIVDGGDLALLLSQWGTTGEADIDGSGLVDGSDLGMLLSAWG
jgi:hypothetical protein